MMHGKMMAVALVAVALAGCSRSDEAPPPEANVTAAARPAPVATATAEPVPAPTSSAVANQTAAVPAEAPRAADEQMMDDASATGMTARSSRDEATPEANEAEAAVPEQIEKK